MKVQFRCKHARLDLDPYREYCALGLQDCTFCQQAEIVTVKQSVDQALEDAKHAEVFYNSTTGRLDYRW